MMPAVARVPMIPVHHHTAPSPPNILVCTKSGVSDYRSEGSGIVHTRTSQMGRWDDYPLLRWALELVGVVWGYWDDWDLLGNDVSGAIMGPPGVAGDSVGGVLGSLGLWGGYWSCGTLPLG